jgi:hypothetical protein
MKKYHAIVIEQSLENKNVLNNFKILNTKHSGDWDLHILEIEDPHEAIKIIQLVMVKDKNYYWHIFNDGSELIIVFNKKIFRLNPKDQSTWKDAQEYGAKELNIIPDQLDFYPTKFNDEPEWLANKD